MSSNIPIIFNQGSWVGGNKFRFTFTNAINLQDYQIGLSSLCMYNSFFNILTTAYITITWQGVAYRCSFPPGFYSVEDINLYLGNFCLSNKLYATDSATSTIEKFFNIQTNTTYYNVNISFYPVQQNSAGTLVIPTGAAWVFDGLTPQISFDSNFSPLLGFPANSIILPDPSATFITASSSFTPQINLVTNVTLRSNVLNIPSSLPTNVLGSVAVTSSLGAQFSLGVTNVLYSDCMASTFQYIDLDLYSQDTNFPLNVGTVMMDSNLLITLSMKRKILKMPNIGPR